VDHVPRSVLPHAGPARYFPGMVTSSTPSHPGPRPWQPLVWLPWLSAPLFFLLPIAGCGVAAAARRPPAAASSSATYPLPGPAPVATMVTVLTPSR